MANLPNTVEIIVSGRRFTIRTDKDPEYVRHLGIKLERMLERIRAGNNRITYDKALIIACLYLLDENESLREQIRDLGMEIQRLHEEGAKILINSRKIAP
ncbi:cell division protein ZapA [Desulfurobacterium sp.]